MDWWVDGRNKKKYWCIFNLNTFSKKRLFPNWTYEQFSHNTARTLKQDRGACQ